MRSALSRPYRNQASAFEGVPQRSLRMTLCLNGTVPVRELAIAEDGGDWLAFYMSEHHPDFVPGYFGPITIVLVL
ncbi:MAG TPA: hypothetical protein VGE01_10855 [Fimbriimonas sp.]